MKETTVVVAIKFFASCFDKQ